jgi:hypothetical protein
VYNYTSQNPSQYEVYCRSGVVYLESHAGEASQVPAGGDEGLHCQGSVRVRHTGLEVASDKVRDEK